MNFSVEARGWPLFKYRAQKNLELLERALFRCYNIKAGVSNIIWPVFLAPLKNTDFTSFTNILILLIVNKFL